MRSHGPSCEKPKCPCSLMSPLVIHRGLLAASSFVESRPLVHSFANIIGVLPLLQASEFYHVRLMKASPKLMVLFRTRIVERFYHNSSHRSPKLMVLDPLERRLDGASK